MEQKDNKRKRDGDKKSEKDKKGKDDEKDGEKKKVEDSSTDSNPEVNTKLDYFGGD